MNNKTVHNSKASKLTFANSESYLSTLRNFVYDEMHARPFYQIPSPVHITHFAFLSDEGEHLQDYQHLLNLCRRYNVNLPDPKAVFFQQDFGKFRLRWEKHSEFSSYTFINPSDVNEAAFENSGLQWVPQDWLNKFSSEPIIALQISVLESATDIRQFSNKEAISHFNGHRLINSHCSKERATICSSFRLDDDGYGRFLLYNRSLSSNQLGKLCVRIVEAETYRILSLLSLPIAKKLSPQIYQMDTNLESLLAELKDTSGLAHKQKLFEQISDMAARLETFRANSNYRFSASRAYNEIALMRLRELDEQKISGYLTFEQFVKRRLVPAMNTCQSVAKRLKDLAIRIDRASELLRTRIELTIQEQNQSLLSRLNKRSEMQLALQKMVEGLSVAAISYYVVSLLKLLFDSSSIFGLYINPKTLLIISIPIVIFSVWGLIRFSHKKLHKKYN